MAGTATVMIYVTPPGAQSCPKPKSRIRLADSFYNPNFRLGPINLRRFQGDKFVRFSRCALRQKTVYQGHVHAKVTDQNCLLFVRLPQTDAQNMGLGWAIRLYTVKLLP